MQRQYDVLCVGQLGADILVRPVNETIFQVDSTPVESMILWPGGDAQNESCVMAKLGMKTALLGKIGHDLWGDAIVDIVEKSGVDLSHLVRDKNIQTCTSIALIFEDGRRNFLYQGGAGRSDPYQDGGWRRGIRGEGRNPDRHQGPLKGQGRSVSEKQGSPRRPLCHTGCTGAGAYE